MIPDLSDDEECGDYEPLAGTARPGGIDPVG